MKILMIAAAVTAMTMSPAVTEAQTGSASAAGQAQVQTPQARIDAALRAAANADIPAELVTSKVAEGEAKRVPPARIAAAVEARVSSLVRASTMLKRADVEARSAGELAVTADALDAGVSESVVVRISRDASEDRRAVAVAVLADLVRVGRSSEVAFNRVSAVLSNSASLASLHAEVASQLKLRGKGSTLDAAGILNIQ